MGKKPTALLSTSLSFRPWLYFFIFLISNTLLSYFTFSFLAKLWIGIIGIATPFGLAFWTVLKMRLAKLSSPSIPALSESTHDADLPWWLWILFISVLLFTRFYRLTSLPFWPISDEGFYSFLSLHQSQHWQWNLLWTETQVEPLMFWLLGLFFKITGPSFFASRLFPALVSIGTVFASYWAARSFLSKFTSFVFCFFVAFSFWEFTLSRFCMCVTLLPLFQCLSFGCLGRLLKTRENHSQCKKLWFLIFFTGIGFYIWTIWVVVWLAIGMILFFSYLSNDRKRMVFLWIFFISTVLMNAPLLIIRFSSGGTTHMQQVINLSSFNPLFQYIKQVFWDGSSGFPFGSNWGGFLNPVLVSLVFIGVLYLIQTGSKLFIFGFLACLFLSILPGALTKNVEMHRIVLLMPYLMALAALGIRRLVPYGSKSKLIVVAAVFMLGSFSLDVYNFIGPYCDLSRLPSQQWRSLEYFNAYQNLKHLSERDGPIDVFTEWNPDYDNKTLNIAVYPFDAAQNPNIVHQTPVWAAFLADVDYEPFLKEKFPHVQAQLLNPSLPSNDLHHLLGLFLIPTSDIPAPVLKNWLDAHRECQQLAFLIKVRKPTIPLTSFEKDFARLAVQYSKDPFLASVLWEKTASFPLMGGNFSAAAFDFQQAVHQGYPAPHLLHNLKLANFLSRSPTQSIQKP
jgi:4-amino-4-deoxy-L-arabinose transferase-like glycosyltransferase